jgi:uncharacterized protein
MIRASLLSLLALAAVVSPAGAQVRLHGEGGGSATVKVMSWREIPFRTVVRQQYDFSCGSAAVATLLTYHYGRKTSEVDVFKSMFAVGDQEKIRRVGFSMLDMKRYLDSQQIKADGFRLSTAELAQRAEPAIVLIDLGKYRHFVVVKGVSNEKILVGDPALGLKIYTLAEFGKIWNGIAFGIHSAQGLPRPTFNVASEWRPWAVAPVDDARLHENAGGALASQLPFYQIAPLRVLDTVTAGGL